MAVPMFFLPFCFAEHHSASGQSEPHVGKIIYSVAPHDGVMKEATMNYSEKYKIFYLLLL